MGFEGISILAAPERSVGALPIPFTDIIPNRVAEYAGQGVILAEVLRQLADDNDDLALILDFGRITRNHHGFVMGDQRIDGPVTHVGFFRDVWGLAADFRLFDHVVGIIQSSRVECPRQ